MEVKSFEVEAVEVVVEEVVLARIVGQIVDYPMLKMFVVVEDTQEHHHLQHQ